MSGTITGAQVHVFADNMAMRAIAMEVLTDGRMALTGKVSGLQALRNRGLIQGRTTRVAGFRKALKAMQERYEGWEPEGSVAKAIAKLEADKK